MRVATNERLCRGIHGSDLPAEEESGSGAVASICGVSHLPDALNIAQFIVAGQQGVDTDLRVNTLTLMWRIGLPPE